jgi:hypothetical protein
MENLNKNFIWLTDSAELARAFSGKFVTLLEGVPCDLELRLNNRLLHGLLELDNSVFEIRAVCSGQTKTAYGFLLESFSHTPIALLRLTPKGEGLLLELDAPDFDEVVKLYEPRGVNFQRRLSF